MTPDPQDQESAPSRLTVAQVAVLAGVSPPTVSKVLHGRPDVASGTREHVERILRDHGYQRQVRQARPSSLLELVMPERDLAHPSGPVLLDAVTMAAQEARLGVVVSPVRADRAGRARLVADLLARRPAGVISGYPGADVGLQQKLQRRRIPLVLLDPHGEPATGIPSVGVNHWGGGVAAVRHLLNLGHRRIVGLPGPLDGLAGRARFDGYRAALDGAGVAAEPVPAPGTGFGFGFEDGLRGAGARLSRPDRPTAFVTGNALQAMGVFAAAAALGLRIPHDLSVVSLDDLPDGALPSTPLTSVQQPLRELAATAMTLVLALGQGEPVPQDRVEFATRLVERGSTAPPADQRRPDRRREVAGG